MASNKTETFSSNSKYKLYKKLITTVEECGYISAYCTPRKVYFFNISSKLQLKKKKLKATPTYLRGLAPTNNLCSFFVLFFTNSFIRP